MKRWEYKEEDLRVLEIPRITDLLNKFDEDGWTFKSLTEYGKIWKLKLKRRKCRHQSN